MLMPLTNPSEGRKMRLELNPRYRLLSMPTPSCEGRKMRLELSLGSAIRVTTPKSKSGKRLLELDTLVSACRGHPPYTLKASGVGKRLASKWFGGRQKAGL